MTEREVLLDLPHWANREVIFRFSPASFTVAQQIPSYRRVVRLDENGAGSVTLWCNEEGDVASSWVCRYPSGEETSSFTVPVGAEAIGLSTLLELGVPEGSAQYQTLITFLESNPTILDPPWQLEVLLRAGTASVADNVLPPGVRIGYALTLTDFYLRAGTGPVGSALTVEVNLNGVLAATVTIAAGATSGSLTGQEIAVAAGDVLTFDITAVGSTTPGADLALSILGA